MFTNLSGVYSLIIWNFWKIDDGGMKEKASFSLVLGSYCI